MPIILPPIARRNFIKGSLTLSGSVVASSSLVVGSDFSAKFDLNRVALLADTHVSADPNQDYPGTKWPGSPCLLYTSPSPRDGLLSRMPSSA